MIGRRVGTVFAAALRFVVAFFVISATAAQAQDGRGSETETSRERAVQILRDGLEDQEGWIKVHAAEFLLELGYAQGVDEVFEEELRAHGEESPYRIGIWRVLARCAAAPVERERYIARIVDAARDGEGPDRLHAVETIAKLGVVLDEAAAREVATWAETASDSDGAFACWVLALSGHESVGPGSQEARLVAMLEAQDPLTRLRAAYALSRLPSVTPATIQAVIGAAIRATNERSRERLELLSDAHILSAAWRLAWYGGQTHPLEREAGGFRAELERRAREDQGVATVFANALADLGQPADTKLLVSLLDAEDSDVRLSAAHALLRLEGRPVRKPRSVSWVVIGAGVMLMLGAGVFYLLRSRDAQH